MDETKILMLHRIYDEVVQEAKNRNRGGEKSRRTFDEISRGIREYKTHSATSISPRKINIIKMFLGGICPCCHQKKPLTVDHIQPTSQKGKDSISNIQLLCMKCNCKKSIQTIRYIPPYEEIKAIVKK